MNHRNQEWISARLERLADGELSPSDYRGLVASLEEEPGAWRQCALAFLEVQALAQELGDVRRPLDARAQEASAGNIAPQSDMKRAQARMLPAVAASFILAFALGLAAPRFLSVVQERFSSGNINEQRPMLADEHADDGLPHHVLRYVGDVRLLVDGSTDGGQVPVYEVDQDVTRYLAGETPVLGPEMVELLRQHGYDVQQDQQYFPAPLDDGRQIIVPVEGYQITPVSRRY